MLHCEQQVAGRDARAAHRDRVRCRHAAELRGEVARQDCRRQEAAVGRNDAGGGVIQGARDMASHRVNRFHLAAIALGCTGVEHPALRIQCRSLRGVRIDCRRRIGAGGEVAVVARRRQFGRRRQAEFPPAPQTAVQHGHLRVTEPPGGHPPEARRPHAGGVVISKDYRVVVDAPLPQFRGEVLRPGQRMAATARGGGRREVVVQVRVNRAGQVTGEVGLVARGGPREFIPAVEDAQPRVAEFGGSLFGADERVP